MNSQRGSVMVFLLIAVALFAALGYAVSQGMRLSQGQTDIITEDKAKLDASSVMDFFQATRTGVQNMILNGRNRNDLDFTAPGGPGFNVAPYDDEVFHTQGGGVGYVPVWETLDDRTETTATAWSFIENTIDGIGSSGGAEVIAALVRVPQKTCEQLNFSLNGSKTIPVEGGDMDNMFVTGSDPVSAANCAACEGVKALCVSNGNVRVFYYVLDRG